MEFWDNHHLAAIAKLCRIRSLVFNVPVTEIALKNVTARNRWRYDLIDFYLCQGDEHAERKGEGRPPGRFLKVQDLAQECAEGASVSHGGSFVR